MWLYQKAQICKMFPAYKLSDLDDVPIIPIMQALELMATADKALS